MRLRLWLTLVAILLLATPAHADSGGLIILTDSGQVRDGLPVLLPHPGGDEVAALLSRGFSGRMLRLYALEQAYLQNQGGPAPEPAYLFLSSRQGGFARFGFHLGDQAKPRAGYVDLKEGSPLAGRLGAMDQIFPHELAHVILRQLIGEWQPGGSNQVHAVAVKTDPIYAFNEGFAEHFQIMAVDDPDADPATLASATDPTTQQWIAEKLSQYRRELSSRFAPATPVLGTFPLWYGGLEQALRYHAVKENAFARTPALPDRLLTSGDPFAAYLLENILPGGPGDPPKTAAQMLATEGVVSTLFYRWAACGPLQESYRDPAFYARFGVSPAEVTPLENVYLKLFDAMYLHKPKDTAQLIAAYKATFPDEAPHVDAVVADVLLGQPLPAAPGIWLANEKFKTGTSLYDQFRGSPRVHTFDLNAATLVDLLGVPGVDRPLAEAIRRGAPYSAVDDLEHVPGMPPAVLERFREMKARMDDLMAHPDETEGGINFAGILLPYLWRLLAVLAVGAVAGAALYRTQVQTAWWRAAVNGLGAALPGLLAGWLVAGPDSAIPALAVPLILFGLPAAAARLWRDRAWRSALRAFLAWALASLPIALLIRPWG